MSSGNNMNDGTRSISYSQAINETLMQAIAGDENVFLIGPGVTTPWYVGGTTVGLLERFGPKRIMDTPVSENAVTGAAVGAALAGMRPVLMHSRMDFMYFAMDQIVNQAANWHYMFGGQLSVPLTVWAIINRGGEQAAQHSQALQVMFAHVPGLKVVMPSTPYDAKGLLMASIYDDNPVIFIDDRWLYEEKGEVPEEKYTVPLGEGIVRRGGTDITLVSISYMATETVKAAAQLEKDGIDAEVVDIRSLKPLDEDLLIKSVKKTGRMAVIDGGWKSYGIGAELAALVTEKAFDYLKAPVRRISLPDAPAPASCTLEKVYYPDADDITSYVKQVLDH
jgi:pyruvate/2-oxoglutarate/acetoin dehydrogenase E1 component